MRANAFVSMPGVHTVVPRLAVAAASAAILLARHKKLPYRPDSETADNLTVSKPANAPAQASAHTTRALNAARSAAARWHPLVHVPNLIISVSSWLAVILLPLRNWMATAVPNLVQLADAREITKPAVEMDTVAAFCGNWVKDSSRSDSMDGFCQLFGVPRWLRQATRLVNGLELATSGDVLLVKQVCKISWLSTTEAFPLDGVHTSAQKRRDMRSGKQFGQLLSATDGTIQLHVSWQGSMAGEATDTLRLVPGKAGVQQELVVLHEASVKEKGSASFKEVYVRRR